jgi:hypothetical protein
VAEEEWNTVVLVSGSGHSQVLTGYSRVFTMAAWLPERVAADMQRTTRNPQYATYNSQNATSNPQYETCNSQHAMLKTLQHATRNADGNNKHATADYY